MSCPVTPRPRPAPPCAACASAQHRLYNARAQPLATAMSHLPRNVLARLASGSQAYCSAPVVGAAAIIAAPPAFTLTLERTTGKSYGAESGLQGTGAFVAEVFPDLPLATTWQTLAKALTPGGASSAAGPQMTEYTTRPGARKVITVAAQLRGMASIEARMVQATGGDPSVPVAQPADALLCVSGSHPVRSIPLVKRLLLSSLDTLKRAEQLKDAGALPRRTELWVVANPNLEPDASMLERKAACGAVTVITQPPFDWPAYERWLADADRRGLLKGGMRLLVGHPMISSAGNANFWLALCGSLTSKEAQKVAAGAALAEQRGKAAAQEYCIEYNRELVRKVQAAGGAAGMHVMPITSAAKKTTMQLLAEGALPGGAAPAGQQA